MDDVTRFSKMYLRRGHFTFAIYDDEAYHYATTMTNARFQHAIITNIVDTTYLYQLLLVTPNNV